MAIKTNSYEDSVLNTMRGTAIAAWTPYIALLTSVSDAEVGTVNEISYTGYGRVAATFGAPSPSGTVANSSAVTFGQMTGGAGGTAVAIGIYDASSGGTLRYVINLTVSKTVGINDTPSFAIGALVVSED